MYLPPPFQRGHFCIAVDGDTFALLSHGGFRLISLLMDSGNDFFLGLMLFSLHDFILRKPSLKKYPEWSEFNRNETVDLKSRLYY